MTNTLHLIVSQMGHRLTSAVSESGPQPWLAASAG
jgi:hypothetical protein